MTANETTPTTTIYAWGGALLCEQCHLLLQSDPDKFDESDGYPADRDGFDELHQCYRCGRALA